MSNQDVEAFARMLENAGFEGALELIQETLIPAAKELHMSLWDAAWEYANPDEEQDTSWFQLSRALFRVSYPKACKLNIHEPL